MKKNLLLLYAIVLLATLAKAQITPGCGTNTDPPAEDCETACIYCNFNGMTANTGSYTGGSVPSFCQSIQNDMWLGFIASSASVTFTVTPSNCQNGDGVQVSLYGGCGEPFVACNGGAPGNGANPVSITAPLTPGTNYFLLIDGYSGDVCDVSISVVPPMAQPVPPSNTITLAGPTTVCPGATVTYAANSTNANAIGYYTWIVPPGSLVNGQPGPVTLDAPDGKTVNITFPPGNVPVFNQQMCVETFNSCFPGATKCKAVNIVPIPKTILPQLFICSEDSPYTLPWGAQAFSSGTYQTTLTSYLGCDSIIEQKISIFSAITKNIGTRVVCEGGSITVCGSVIDIDGPFTKVCPSALGCDSTVIGNLSILAPEAQIIGAHTICAGQPITLHAASTSGNTKWYNQATGVLLSTEDTLTVTQTGSYILTSAMTQTSPSGPVTCMQSDTILIDTSSNQPPTVLATGGIIGCAAPKVILSAVSPNPEVTFSWTGPGNYTATAPVDTISVAGIYSVTVTNTDGCTSSAMASVLLEDKTGTFVLSPNPAQINFILPALTDVPIPAIVQNLDTAAIDLTWKRTFINLNSNCAVRVEDKIAYYPQTVSTGSFSLAIGESAPLTVHLIDTTTTTCCGVVRLLCRNACTLKDTLTMVYIAGCSVGTNAPEVADLQVFPNPGTGVFQVKGHLPEQAIFIKIFALNGMLITSERLADNRTFSLAGKAAGTYIVVFEDSEKRPVKAVEVVLLR